MGLAVLVALPAVAAECPPQGLAVKPPEIRLETGIAEPVWRNDRSPQQLSVLAGKAVELKGFRHSGLTESRTDLHITPSFRWVSYADGRACLMLTKVEASWRIVDITVDVAREFSPGSCQHRVVYDHEAEHVAITRAVYLDWVPKVEARLTESAFRIGPVLVRDPQAAAQRLTATLKKSIKAVLRVYQSELIARQAVIDTPDRYRAESAKCPKW